VLQAVKYNKVSLLQHSAVPGEFAAKNARNCNRDELLLLLVLLFLLLPLFIFFVYSLLLRLLLDHMMHILGFSFRLLQEH